MAAEEARFADFIDYDKVEDYRDFTGVRIEDDVLVTAKGSRVLGKPIPKAVKDIEKSWPGERPGSEERARLPPRRRPRDP